MRKLILLNVIFLTFLSFIEVKAQLMHAKCSRATIESFSKSENEPVLQYMDDARKTADKFMRLLADGKFDEIYSSNRRTKIYVQGNPAVGMDLTTFEQTQGKVISLKFVTQHILWSLSDYLIHLNGSIGTWYAVKTTKTKDVFIMLVESQRARNSQNIIVEDVFYKVLKPELLGSKELKINVRDCPNQNGILNMASNNR